MEIQPRSAWDARPPAGTVNTVPPSHRTEHWTHYNGGPLRLTDHPSCLRAVRAMQEYHINGRGWVDIGYNALVCPHGAVIEGRGLDAVGAHCVDHNRLGYGIQIMIGDGEAATAIQLTAARDLWAYLGARSGHTLSRFGHRDGMSTACPGDTLYRWVHAGMPVQQPPPPTPTPPQPTTRDTDMGKILRVSPAYDTNQTDDSLWYVGDGAIQLQTPEEARRVRRVLTAAPDDMVLAAELDTFRAVVARARATQ